MIHVSYASKYESCLLYIYIWVMSLTHLYMGPVSYTSIYESSLLYIYIWVVFLIHLYTSQVSYTSIYESCLLYIYIWVMSPIHLYMSHVSLASSPGLVRPQRDFVCCKCVPPDWFDSRGFLSCKCESASHHWFDSSVSSLRNLAMIAMPSMREPNQMFSVWFLPIIAEAALGKASHTRVVSGFFLSLKPM